MSTTQADKAERFLKLHKKGEPLLMPNAWDVGSAGILAWLGFQALATTSSGHAATLGRLDGGVTREAALAHATEMSAGTELPVSADLENAFADDPDGVADTIRRARATGLAGCSVEDYSGRPDDPIYERRLARERVVAAAEIAHSGPVRMVLTARAENLIRGRDDLADTIERLQAYQEAGADVLFAPGLTSAKDIRQVVESVDRPVSVLALRGAPSTSELAALGVARVSVGGAFAFAAIGALREAAEELRDRGTYGYLERTAVGVQTARAAFKPSA
ncbi:MAG TPA: isocitrate lyase/phosphoenolpyruvate mutase family protein [Solirubrobacteraceae bacterium]|nr:isocitrate lyase/phosphoenolpyruvate mutase family protein [Solirubrobacteraceae bacterium]